ncbi:MAG TPA: outer membrane lipoprotein-sorting protein [Burkholderiaceae bacterium]|nr:outer membrane lipoprotein-sorting protein [Burkholderiaceae bacterium]
MLLAGMVAAGWLPALAWAEPTAQEILDRADDTVDIKLSQVDLEMLVYRNNELRKTYRMALRYQDADHTMAETSFPPRNQGEKMLQAGRGNYWLFLPNLNKAVRISESNSFSNGDFSNGDILSPRLSNEYDAKLLGVETANAVEMYKLELTARNDSVAYAKIIYWIRRSDFFPIRREYYTFSQQLLKRLDFSVTGNAMPKGLPDTLLMTSVLERDKKTVIRYTKYTPVKAFPPGTFDENNLMRR